MRNAPIRPVRIAAVGLGWVCEHRHLPAVARQPRWFDLVGVIDRRGERAVELARRFGARRWSDAERLRDVDWIDEVEAVCVATAPSAHHPIVREALDLGLHVLTEKPFAMCPEEGEDLIQRAARRGLVLAVVHNFQFASAARRLWRDIARGRLGAVRAVSGFQLGNPRRRLPTWYETLPFGLFYDESPHLLYLMRRAAPGPLQLLHAHAFPSRDGLNTPAHVHAEFAAQPETGPPVPVTLRCHFESPVSEWYLVVEGERALAAVDIFRNIYLRLPNDGRHTAPTVVRTSLCATLQHWLQHAPNAWRMLRGRMLYGNETVFRRFAEAVRAMRPPADIGPEDALCVLRLQHEILDAARKHPVSLHPARMHPKEDRDEQLPRARQRAAG